MGTTSYGVHDGKTQLMVYKADGYRLDIGDIVELEHHGFGTITPILARTCGVRDSLSGWTRHLMCTEALPKCEFFLLCLSEWAVQPGRLLEAQVIMNNGLEQALFYLKHPDIRLPPKRYARYIRSWPADNCAAEFVARRDYARYISLPPKKQTELITRIARARTPSNSYGWLLWWNMAE